MTVIWIVVGLGVAGAVMAFWSARGAGVAGTPTSVPASSQWIAEQRLMQGPTRRR